MAKVTAQQISGMLSDRSMPIDGRVAALVMMLNDPDDAVQHACRQSIELLLNRQCSDETVAATQAKLDEWIEELSKGPQKHGTFIGMTDELKFGIRRCLVETESGDTIYTTPAEPTLLDNLKRGDQLRLAIPSGVIMGRGAEVAPVGETCTLTRKVDNHRVEVKMRGDESSVVYVTDSISDAIERGDLRPGGPLVLNSHRTVAMEWLKPEEGLKHYRFLERVPVPDVRVERDIGAPPKCIEELSEIIRLEMTNPDVRRKYKLRRCVMKLLSGVSGAGKTLAIHAIWRRMYEVMSEITGLRIEDLPPRVFWLRPAQLLSKWFGESEQLIEAAMNEVQDLADEVHLAKNGDEIRLPVLVVLEEIDGIARSRTDTDPVYSRVLTTLLQRLDPGQPSLQQRLIVFIGTTNEPGQVDRAFLRRIGGTVEVFGGLDRKGFMLVLDKHLRGMPLESDGTMSQNATRQKFTNRLATWLFDQPECSGLVEITMQGHQPKVFHKREFITGGLIDRAVQQAAVAASDREAKKGTEGVSFETLAKSIDDQLVSLAGQLTPNNVGRYVTLPDGVTVSRLQRIPQQPLSI